MTTIADKVKTHIMAIETPAVAPDVSATAAPSSPAPDEFADAFASLNAPAADPAPVVAAVPAEIVPAPAGDPAPAADPAPVVAAVPAVLADSAPAGDPVPTPIPAATAAAAVAPVAPVIDEMATLRAEIAALKAAKPAPAEPAPVAQPAAPAEPYTATEVDQIKKYREDWPDISAGEALLRREEYKDLVRYVFAEFNRVVAPIQQFVGSQGTRTQYDDIVALVPDYDDVRDKTLEWIETQPEYLKAAYKQVTGNGTPADIADLIDRYKKDTGYAPPAAVVAAAPAVQTAPVVTAAALPAAAAAVVPALRAVQSSRSAQSAPVDKNNFDDAFAEFAAVK